MSVHKIVDVTKGTETLVDYTEQELAEQEASKTKIAEQEFLAAQRAVDRAALLERLGITADEAELLLS
ncbi:hypothetical protein UFOVP720_21 [uncultured Caudovirales phage]|uniref:Uncharacterized protein n=1 Tax=uncultured Caudovirales phage TaxID=2100421 RepID=A0A6J5NLY8_9CAUD|nr:hypothetical protein UFOVP720_21 [uncultured Caudovirales phage]